MSTFIASKTRDVHREYVRYTSGSTGAVPAALDRSRGVTSITRLATGTFKAILDRGFSDLTDFNGAVEQAAVIAGDYTDFDPTKACDCKLVAVAADGKSFVFVTTTLNSGVSAASGSIIADPASGDVVRFSYEAKRSQGLA